MTNVMNKGTIEDRANALIRAMDSGKYKLVTTQHGMTVLASCEDSWFTLIPADLMQYLVERDLIGLSGGQLQ